MSNRIFQAVWDCGPESRSQMLVLMVLADSADAETAYCWPSVATIARGARMNERTARYTLRALEAEGWITTEIRPRPNGSQTSNGYKINIAKLGLQTLEERRAQAKRKRSEKISGSEKISVAVRKKFPGTWAEKKSVPEQTNKNIPAVPIFSLKKDDLSAFDRTCIREGKSVMVAGQMVKPDSEEMRYLKTLLSGDRS